MIIYDSGDRSNKGNFNLRDSRIQHTRCRIQDCKAEQACRKTWRRADSDCGAVDGDGKHGAFTGDLK